MAKTHDENNVSRGGNFLFLAGKEENLVDKSTHQTKEISSGSQELEAAHIVSKNIKKMEPLKRSLTASISIPLIPEELAIFQKKMEGINMGDGDLMREYILTLSVLKIDTKSKGKSKLKASVE